MSDPSDLLFQAVVTLNVRAGTDSVPGESTKILTAKPALQPQAVYLEHSLQKHGVLQLLGDPGTSDQIPVVPSIGKSFLAL